MTSPGLLASYNNIAVMRTEHQAPSTETVSLVQLRKITYKINHGVLSIMGFL
jgi:hypothetical protein